MRCRTVAPVLFTVLGVVGPALAGEGDRAIPEPAELSWIEASIRAVQASGLAERVSREHGVSLADGTRALPVRHVVRCETASACSGVARWATRAGLVPSAIEEAFEHGSVPYYEVRLRQRVPLVSARIREEALRIHEALQALPGTGYDTWMLDLDPEGARDAS